MYFPLTIPLPISDAIEGMSRCYTDEGSAGQSIDFSFDGCDVGGGRDDVGGEEAITGSRFRLSAFEKIS